MFSRSLLFSDHWSNVTACGVFWLVAEKGSRAIFLSHEEFIAQQKVSLKEPVFFKTFIFYFRSSIELLYNRMAFLTWIPAETFMVFYTIYFQCYRLGAIGCSTMTAWSHFSAGSVLLLMAPIYSLQVCENVHYNLHCVHFALVRHVSGLVSNC